MLNEWIYKLKEFKGYLVSNSEERDTSPNRKYIHHSLKNDVEKRDNNKCFICGTEDELEAHHIFGFSEYPFMGIYPANVITLCHTCHKNYHDKYNSINGITWSEYLRDLKKPLVKYVPKIKTVEVYPEQEALVNDDPAGTVMHVIRKEKHINHGKLLSVMDRKYNVPTSQTESIIRRFLNRGTIIDVGGEYYMRV